MCYLLAWSVWFLFAWQPSLALSALEASLEDWGPMDSNYDRQTRSLSNNDYRPATRGGENKDCAVHRLKKGETLIDIAARFGTSPYTITRSNPSLTSNNPFRLAEVETDLTVCPEDSRFRQDGGRLLECLSKYPRPCRAYEGKEREDCFCAYHRDGMYKYPFAENCRTYITCKAFRSEGMGQCPKHKIAADYGPDAALLATYEELRTKGASSGDQSPAVVNKEKVYGYPVGHDSTNICIDPPLAFCCNPEPCAHVYCYPFEWLIPEDSYNNPFDGSFRMFFRTDSRLRWIEDMVCGDLQSYNPTTSQCEFDICCKENKVSVYNFEFVYLPSLVNCPGSYGRTFRDERGKELTCDAYEPLLLRHWTPAPTSKTSNNKGQGRKLLQKPRTSGERVESNRNGNRDATQSNAARRGGCQAPPPSACPGGVPCVGSCGGGSGRRRLQNLADLHKGPQAPYYALYIGDTPFAGLKRAQK